MDDQGLGQQRFDEPAGLEQSGIVPRAEHEQHHEEGQVVEDRADRSDQQHEAREVADVPLARHRQVFLIHVVGRDGGLGEVVQQVVGQNLDRQHRQERQEDAGAEHAEHVPEVRAGAHLDIFDDVAEHLAALDRPVVQHGQALFEQDDVRRFLGDVHRGIDGDADIGRLQRRAVVDAVAEIADHVATQVQRLDHPRLLRRGNLGEHRDLLGDRAQFGVRQRLQFMAENDAVHRQVDLAADRAGDHVVVAGEDLHADAGGMQQLDRRHRAFLRRIEEGDVAK